MLPRPLHWSLRLLAAATLSGALAAAPKPVDGPRPTLALQVGHSGVLTCLAFSPDGKTVATGSQDGTARLWDVPSRQVKAILQGRPGRESLVWTLAFSPDGTMVATGSLDGRARLWDARSGQLRATLKGHTSAVWTLAFSPDGKMLATGSWDRTVRLWDADRRQLKAILPGHRGSVFSLAFSPDGKTLATGSDREARLWDLLSGRLKQVLKGHTSAVWTLAYSSDGQTLATGSSGRDKTVRLWEAHSGQLKASLPGHEGDKTVLAFSPDGKTLATGSGTARSDGGKLPGPSGVARLWDAHSGQLKATLLGHYTVVQSLAFSPDGKTLATADANDTRLWDAHTGQPQATLQRDGGGAFRLAFSPDGRTLAVGNFAGTVQLWDPRSGQLRGALQRQTVSVSDVTFAPDGKMLATGNYDGMARLWDLDSGRLLVTLQGHGSFIGVIAFSPDGKLLAMGSGDATSGEVGLWDAHSGQLKATLRERMAPVWALAFSPDGNTLAAGGGVSGLEAGKSAGFGEARLWDVPSGQLTASLRGHRRPIDTLAFSPDGTLLATGSGEDATSGEAKLWDAHSGQLKATLQVHGNQVAPITFSPDGKTIATGSRDERVQLWDVSSGRLKASWRAQTRQFSVIAFSSDGNTLGTCDLGGQVRLWNVATGNPLPLTARTQWANFPPGIAQPFSIAGAAVSRHDPRSGRVLAILLPIPEVAAAAAAARPIEVGAKPIDGDARPAAAGSGGEWFVATPEGYFDCSANAARFIRWNVNGALYPAERYLRRFRRPDLVHRALRGERIPAPAMTADDIPPTVRFLGLKNGDRVPADPVTVTVEVRGKRAIKEVELLVNGRPLPPDRARPITVGAKPIEVGAKEGVATDRLARRFTFRVPLPRGAEAIHLRAIAYDISDLGSDPVEIVLRRPGAQSVPGQLYVLSVGVSRYRNAARQRFPNLQFPAADARAIADRFRREGKPLYEQVHVRMLTDDEATAANVRAGLQWLQQSVRPGQIDTVVIFLSGHGISVDGRYYFATYETDLKDLAGSSLSGRELREALGGKLRAKAVFLFVDTCHAGGLSGRNDDLALEVGEEVYVMASSGAREYAYESAAWGHGAFTLGLLRGLDSKELARDG